MTEDTKRALAIIEPMAKELGLHTCADAHYLFINGQAIGIACNSTYATVMEFIGYLVFVWAKDRCASVPPQLADHIKRYWYTSEQVAQFRKAREI